MDKYPEFEKILDGLAVKYGGITGLVSGGAKGGDRYAELYAERKGLPITIHKPDWDRYGKSAGFIRNKSIIDDADVIVAIWDGKSKGTQHSMRLARE